MLSSLLSSPTLRSFAHSLGSGLLVFIKGPCRGGRGRRRIPLFARRLETREVLWKNGKAVPTMAITLEACDAWGSGDDRALGYERPRPRSQEIPPRL